MHHTFKYISLPLMHYYDLKMSNFTFLWRTKTSDLDEIFFPCLNLDMVPSNSASKDRSLAYEKVSEKNNCNEE